jgi:hypothetical protein
MSEELSGVHNWEVGPCVNHLGNVTSWDINIKPREGDKGVVVVASVYSGEAVARAILAAIQSTVEHPLARMVRIDEELGLYDTDEKVPPPPSEEQP